MVRGWIVGNVNTGGMKNAPAIDLLAAKDKRTVRLAVKTTGHTSSDVQWNAKFGWSSLFKGDVVPDYVIFVWFDDAKDLDHCRVFVVPSKTVDRDVRKAHEHWHSHPRKDGAARAQGDHVGISWRGKDTKGNIAYNFANKWKQYENAWNLLERR